MENAQVSFQAVVFQHWRRFNACLPVGARAVGGDNYDNDGD
jgi:hypothetical protein